MNLTSLTLPSYVRLCKCVRHVSLICHTLSLSYTLLYMHALLVLLLLVRITTQLPIQ
jgi:hypothetical protein